MLNKFRMSSLADKFAKEEAEIKPAKIKRSKKPLKGIKKVKK
ncbi:MAG: hypothetical protein PHW73_02265 [Atribacterota bacterium]|nr:hypothetical protein [Atribacterota bacterium]